MNEIPEGKMEKIAHLLVELGVPKNSAKVLSYIILNDDNTKTAEVEVKTGLRQPEVSIAVKHLRSLGWLSKTEIKKEVKGRPVHLYKLSMTSQALFQELEKNQRKKITQLEESLSKLKTEING